MSMELAAESAEAPSKFWRRQPLGDVVDILDSRRVPVNASEREKRLGNVPYYGATGQVGWIDQALFEEELVLLGEDGAPFLEPTRAKAYLVVGKAWVNNHAHVLRGKEGLLNRFLVHQLNQVDYRGFVSGSTRLKLPQGTMKQIMLVVPPLPEQQRIVAEIEKQLTRLEAGVAALRRAQANLKRYRAAVLKAACEGRLVPTEAELARREGREYESGEQILARTLQAVPQSKGTPAPGSASDLPALPEGWTWATFQQLSKRVTVGHVGPMKHEYVAEGVPFLRSQNIRPGRFDPDGLLHIRREFHSKLAKSVVRPGDLAVVRSGSVGVTCVIPESLGEANCSDLVLIQGPRALNPYFGAYYMNSIARRRVEAGKVGVALTHFNTKAVAAMPVPLPPLAEQHRIVAEVERRLSVIEELEAAVAANLARAARLRQAILQRAFSGQLVAPAPA